MELKRGRLPLQLMLQTGINIIVEFSVTAVLTEISIMVWLQLDSQMNIGSSEILGAQDGEREDI